MNLKPGFKLEYVIPDVLTTVPYEGSTYSTKRFMLHNPPSKTVLGIEGIGFSEKEFSTIRLPYQHGNSLLGLKLQEREISVTFSLVTNCKKEYEDTRTLLLDTFRENRNPDFTKLNILLFTYYDNVNYITRAIKVYYSGGLKLDKPISDTWDSFSFRETVTFKAPFPVFYDPTLVSSTFTFASSSALPVSLPYIFGSYKAVEVVNYTGTWETFPQFLFTPPLNRIRIVNETTGKEIILEQSLTSSTILLQTGYKAYAKSYSGEEYTQYFSGDLESFSLLPGSNTIRVYSDSVCNGSLGMRYYKNYRGI